MFAQLIARTAKDIEVLIESLPNEESSIELQSASLQKLEEENSESANKLEEVVKQGMWHCDSRKYKVGVFREIWGRLNWRNKIFDKI